MVPSTLRRLVTFVGLILHTAATGAATAARAQAPPTGQDPPLARAQAALETCAVGSGSATDGKRAADDAERQFRALLRSGTASAESAEVRTGLAQVLIRCQLPHTGVTGIMALIAEAETQLRSVLASEPEHWNARFTLAMLLRNMPAMLGRASDAVREFENLIARQGARSDQSHYALPFVHLGDLHETGGRRNAAIETWRRGLALFPAHPELRARLTNIGGDVVPDSAWLSTLLAAPPLAAEAMSHGNELPAIIAFAPLRAEAINHHFQEARAGTTLRRLDIYTMPGGTGEMLQALQAMPGATRAGDGAELYIRGGDPAETPVFFDGGRLAFPGRWESLQGSAMGVVDASVLRRAYFSSGGFSARYGNALSGVVDVETEGRPARASHRYGINMVQAGTTVRAQTGERTGMWGTLSGTDTRIITRMTGEAESYTRAPQSVQGIGGVTFEPLPGIELRTTALAMADRFGRVFEMNGHAGEFESWSSMQHVALSARALRPDGQRGVSASLTASRRENGMRFGVLDRERDDIALGGRIDSDFVVSSATRVRSGIEALRFGAGSEGRVPSSPDLAPGAPWRVLQRETESAWHAGGYVEAEHAPAAGFAIVAGVRVDALPGETGATVDPRIGAAYTAGDWTVRAGAGVFHQGSWRTRYRLPDPGQPSGTPTRAEHVVAGLERAGALSLRAEAYVKRYDDYVHEGAGPAIRAGLNTGVDAIARWSPRSGPTGWASWSLLRSRVDLANGEGVPSALDVTHSLTAVARMPLGPDWEIGSTGRYATGKPFTPVVGHVLGAPQYGAIHGERLPDYYRLDARVTRYFFGQPGRTALAYLEMLNLLDRQNVMSYTWASGSTQRVPISTVFAHRTFVLGVEFQFN
jgi:vitamin B12 transporter